MPAGKILVVDDDPDFVEITRIVLEKAGYQVVSANNGAAALDRVKADRPDLLLLDVMMRTVTDGLDACQRLRTDPISKYLPVIMMTAIAETPYSGEVTTSDATCADAWLAKPVSPQRLLQTVQSLLEGM